MAIILAHGFLSHDKRAIDKQGPRPLTIAPYCIAGDEKTFKNALSLCTLEHVLRSISKRYKSHFRFTEQQLKLQNW